MYVCVCAFVRVVALTSGLTLSVCGAVKEILTFGSAAIMLGEQLDSFKISGFGICLLGVLTYHWYRTSTTSQKSSRDELL